MKFVVGNLYKVKEGHKFPFRLKHKMTKICYSNEEVLLLVEIISSWNGDDGFLLFLNPDGNVGGFWKWSAKKFLEEVQT